MKKSKKKLKIKDLFQKLISFLPKSFKSLLTCALILALAISLTVMVSISIHKQRINSDSFNLRNIFNSIIIISEKKDLSTSELLTEAEDLFNKHSYEESFKLYTQLHNENNLKATLNLGYMYSNGLGCEKNFSEACRKYKYIIKNTLDDELRSIAINNYLYINLITPTSLDNTLDALEYCHKYNDKNANLYFAYLETGYIRDENYLENAKLFYNKDRELKLSILEKQLIISDTKLQTFTNDSPPSDSPFIIYIKHSDIPYLYQDGETTVILPNLKNKKTIPIYSFDNIHTYIVKYYKFKFADCLFKNEIFCR